MHSERFREALQAAGYEYDSSIIEPFNTASSPSWAQRSFPYSMDAGIPQVGGRGAGRVPPRLPQGLHPSIKQEAGAASPPADVVARPPRLLVYPERWAVG